MISSLRLFMMILAAGKNADLIMSSTSDSWHSKIAFSAGKLLKKPVALRKEVWVGNGNLRNKILDSMTLFIEKNSSAVFYDGRKQKEFLLGRGIHPDKLFPFPRLVKDLKKDPLDMSLVNDLKTKFGSKLKFLYLGRVIPQKGLDLLINVFLRLQQDYEDILLLVVGGPSRRGFFKRTSPKYYQHCRDLAKNAAGILFWDEVRPAAVHNYYYFADLFVHPHKKYLDGKAPVYEGWGNVVVEAAAMGLPLIVSDRVPSAFELIENEVNGFIVNSDHLEASLYNAMKFFLDNSDKLEEFGRKSRQMYEKFNHPETMVNSIRAGFQK
jgi:glycosyltransferase involved in cell wall biosynthesis